MELNSSSGVSSAMLSTTNRYYRWAEGHTFFMDRTPAQVLSPVPYYCVDISKLEQAFNNKWLRILLKGSGLAGSMQGCFALFGDWK